MQLVVLVSLRYRSVNIERSSPSKSYFKKTNTKFTVGCGSDVEQEESVTSKTKDVLHVCGNRYTASFVIIYNHKSYGSLSVVTTIKCIYKGL